MSSKSVVFFSLFALLTLGSGDADKSGSRNLESGGISSASSDCDAASRFCSMRCISEPPGCYEKCMRESGC